MSRTPAAGREPRTLASLNFIECEIFAFAFEEECERANPREPVGAVLERAMSRVEIWLDRRANRVART